MKTPALAKLLVVEDDADVLDMLRLHLQRTALFQISTATDGGSALRIARDEMPSVIVLDLMLPKMSGLEICRSLKGSSATAGIAILMLTAKADEVDRIVGLELGADDYVTKPFSPREVVLRVQSLLRRRHDVILDEDLSAGAICLHLSRHEVTVARKPVQLTSVEFNLLAMLLQRRGRVQSRDKLLNEVWGYSSSIDTRTVDTHVLRLRKKLGRAGDVIETVRGFGYRIRER